MLQHLKHSTWRRWPNAKMVVVSHTLVLQLQEAAGQHNHQHCHGAGLAQIPTECPRYCTQFVHAGLRSTQQLFTMLNARHSLLHWGHSTPSSSRFPQGWTFLQQTYVLWCFLQQGAPKGYLAPSPSGTEHHKPGPGDTCHLAALVSWAVRTHLTHFGVSVRHQSWHQQLLWPETQHWAPAHCWIHPCLHRAAGADKTHRWPETASANSTIHKLSNYSPLKNIFITYIILVFLRKKRHFFFQVKIIGALRQKACFFCLAEGGISWSCWKTTVLDWY